MSLCRNQQQLDFRKYNSSISQISDCEVHDRPNEEWEKLERQFILWTVRYIAHRTGGITAY
jgi:hypothetical protein